MIWKNSNIFCNSFSQDLNEKISIILKGIAENQPADQLFLHLDRNLYHGGDTIRFQAYIRDSQTGVFETPSKSLNVLLLNSDHVTIDSARFRISYSTASVAKTAEEYKFARAFTLYSKDFENAHYFDDIVSITVLKGPQGFTMYGNSASDGAILVTTKTGNRINGIPNPDEESSLRDDLLKEVKVFRSEVEYYIPTKEQVEIVPEYQFRPTLLWKNDVYLEGSGPVKFKYPNNSGKGTVIVFVNGVSLTNQVGSNKLFYKVK